MVIFFLKLYNSLTHSYNIFKCGIFSVLHKCHETASISHKSREGCVSRVQTCRPHTRVIALLQVDCTSICALERESLAKFESWVLTSNKGLRASWTLHESIRHSLNIASESDVAFKRYCMHTLCILWNFFDLRCESGTNKKICDLLSKNLTSLHNSDFEKNSI